MDSLISAKFPEIPAIGKTELKKIYMYAACDVDSSKMLASAGIEVSFTPIHENYANLDIQILHLVASPAIGINFRL